MVPALWPLTLVGLIPLLLALENTRHSAKSSFALGLLAGLVLYGIALFAIFWHALPLDWLGALDTPFQIVLVALSWGMTVLGCALWTGFFGLAFSRFAENSWRDILTVSALWVIAEWASAWWFGIQNFGTGSVVEPHATLAFLGNTLSRDEVLVQLAWAGGVYALSAFVAASSALAYRMMRGNSRERHALTLIALALFISWLAGHMALARVADTEGGTRIRIAMVSTQQPAVYVPTKEQNAESLQAFVDILPQTRGADIVVLPEGSGFLNLLREPAPANAASVLRSVYAGAPPPALIDSGSAYSSHGTLRSRMEVYDTGKGTSESEDKRFILPYGEYMPTYVRVFVAMIGKEASLAPIVAGRGLTPGDDTRPLTAGPASVGALFCDEAMSPVLYRSLAARGADVLINVSSHGWFHGSHLVADQMLNVAIVRAVESRRWYVQASDVSPSFALDPYGRVATSSAWGTMGAITVSAEARDDITPYVRFGPWVIWSAFLVLLITYVRSRWRV